MSEFSRQYEITTNYFKLPINFQYMVHHFQNKIVKYLLKIHRKLY